MMVSFLFAEKFNLCRVCREKIVKAAKKLGKISCLVIREQKDVGHH